MLTRTTHIWLCMQTWPEDQFPMQPVGKMVLDQCAGNIFNEVEQIAFSPSMLVPGELPPEICSWHHSYHEPACTGAAAEPAFSMCLAPSLCLGM